jgi:hypothetical protein
VCYWDHPFFKSDSAEGVEGLHGGSGFGASSRLGAAEPEKTSFITEEDPFVSVEEGNKGISLRRPHSVR